MFQQITIIIRPAGIINTGNGAVDLKYVLNYLISLSFQLIPRIVNVAFFYYIILKLLNVVVLTL